MTVCAEDNVAALRSATIGEANIVSECVCVVIERGTPQIEIEAGVGTQWLCTIPRICRLSLAGLASIRPRC